MKFTVDKKELLVVLKLEDMKLNTLNAPELKSELLVLNAEGYSNIILDLSQVNLIDSSGLSAILVANRLCKQSKGSLVLCGIHPNVQKLIGISQLDSILQIMPTLAEAKDFIKMEELTRQIVGSEEE